MARLLRINANTLIYHVFSRGNNRDPVFFKTADYQRFLDNLDRYQEELGYKLYAYCLLPNHFHLLLVPQKKSLSAIMQILITAYTMYVHKKHNRVGHIFQGRFKSIVVEKEAYLLEVSRYIHLNPVRAGLVDAVEEYPWSSYQKYLAAGGDKPSVSIEEILAIFSSDPVRQKQLFIEFTQAGLGKDFDPEREQTRGVLGSAKFYQRITKVLAGSRP